MGLHIGAAWRIRLNRPCVVVMQLFLSSYFDHLLVLSAVWLTSKMSSVHSVREWLAGFSLSLVGLFLSGSLVCVL